MSDAALEVRLGGKPGGISERAFTGTLDNVTRALEELDRILEPRRTSRPVWNVTHTAWETDGSARVQLTPDLRSSSSRSFEEVSRPTAELWGGIRSLDRLPEIPNMFTESVVERVSSLRGLIDRPRSGLASIALVPLMVDSPRPPADVSESVHSNAQAAIAAASLSYGSLIGRLDLISARGRYRKIGLYADGGVAVNCNVDKIPYPELFALFDQRVAAIGLLRRNASGQPVRLDVDSIERIPESAVVGSAALLGAIPDLGGDLTAVEYVRSRRGK